MIAMRLTKSRREIDRIDKKIVELLNKRAKETLSIRKIKRTLKKDIYTPHREKEIYEKIIKENKGPLSAESMKAIYREIMSGSLSLEKPVSVAYLGPPLTFTNIAALSKFGSSVEYIDCSGIGEVFNEATRAHAVGARNIQIDGDVLPGATQSETPGQSVRGIEDQIDIRD